MNGNITTCLINTNKQNKRDIINDVRKNDDLTNLSGNKILFPLNLQKPIFQLVAKKIDNENNFRNPSINDVTNQKCNRGKEHQVKFLKPAPGNTNGCSNCNVTVSPLWRKGDGKLLCNKCGIYWHRYGRHRPIRNLDKLGGNNLIENCEFKFYKPKEDMKTNSNSPKNPSKKSSKFKHETLLNTGVGSLSTFNQNDIMFLLQSNFSLQRTNAENILGNSYNFTALTFDGYTFKIGHN